MRFSNGDVVTLTPRVKAVCVEPEKYERGVVTDDSGIWNIYEVKWNGIDHSIAMRGDEIMIAKEENSARTNQGRVL